MARNSKATSVHNSQLGRPNGMAGAAATSVVEGLSGSAGKFFILPVKLRPLGSSIEA
jgi:hypothetical protein